LELLKGGITHSAFPPVLRLQQRHEGDALVSRRKCRDGLGLRQGVHGGRLFDRRLDPEATSVVVLERGMRHIWISPPLADPHDAYSSVGP
jgi:hypothetical protein